MFLMIRQIEVGAVVDALELLPAEREFILDVERVRGVMRELILAVLMPTQFLVSNPEPLDPIHPFRAPGLEPLVLRAGFPENQNLHRLDPRGRKLKVAGGGPVPEGL